MMTTGWRQSWSPRMGREHVAAPDTRPQRAAATVPQPRAPGPRRYSTGVAGIKTISKKGER